MSLASQGFVTGSDDEEGTLARELARLVLSGNVGRLPLGDLPDANAAYRFQERALAATGLRRLGYKIGATSTEAQAFLGSDGPIYGPILGGRLLANGAELRTCEELLGVECEFAFRVGRAYPEAGEAVSLFGLREAVAECFPALEVAARRSNGDVPVSAVGTIADLCFAYAVICGEPIPDWRQRDLRMLPVILRRDGAVIAKGSGARVLGEPLEPLRWLAAILASTGRSIGAGETVVTGSCTGITPVAAGDVVDATFADLPPVRARFV